MSQIQKFLFDGLPVRGVIVRLTDPWKEVLTRRVSNSSNDAYPRTVQDMLGEMVAGAARMAQSAGLEPAALRRRVTSPGGTTEAALTVLMERDIRRLIRDAVQAAARRSGELSRA